MRKLLVLLTSCVIVTPSITQVIACSPDNTLKIAFVPSIDSVKVMNIVRPLQAKLQTEIHRLDPDWNQKVTIQTTTNYEAAGQALQDGKVGLAFLPVGTYTKYWGNQTDKAGNHSDLAPLVVADRWAMKPDDQANTRDSRNIDFNKAQSILQYYKNDAVGVTSKKTAYANLYTNDKPISYYRSEILANNTFLENNKIDMATLFTHDEKTYKQIMYNLVKKAVDDGKFNLLMSDTSGAGVIYPLAWLIDIGFDPLKSAEAGTYLKAILTGSRATSYSVASQNITTQAAEMTVGYTDIRADMTGDDNVKAAYTNSSIVGITNGIYNDGISYSKAAIKDPVLLNAIRTAFKNLINDKDNASIFSVYQHTDYEIPDSIAESAGWEAKYDQAYQDNMNEKALSEVYKILQNY